MKKHLFLLALLAFTQNVKAGYAPIDIQIADGEEYQIDQIVASQVINQTGWDGQYILTGGVARIYIDFLPRQWPDGRQNILFERWYVQEQTGGGYWLYHEGHGGANPATITFNSPYDAYQWLISDDGVRYCGEWMTTQDDEDGLGEYLDTSTMSTVDYRNSTSSNDANWVLEYNQKSLATMQNRIEFLQETDILNYSQVPINGVRITVTNSTGQTVNQIDYTQYLLDIQSLINQVISRLGRINSDTSATVAALQYLINALGFSNDPTAESLHEFLAQWRTTDGINQGNILNSITNVTDYTEFLKYYIFSGGGSITNNQVKNNLQLLYMYPEALSWNFGLSGSLDYEDYNRLYGKWYSGIEGLYGLLGSSFWGDNPAISIFQLSQDILKYNTDLALAYNDMERQESALSWLNLATNDLHSFTYWLNQHTFTQSGTNDISAAQQKFDAITNQYSQISLVGANASNTAQNWDYFKRLEMLLAAIVYKQTDLSKIGEADDDNGTELANDNTVSAAVSSAEQDISTSLSAVASSLSLTGLESSKNNLVSLWQIAVGAFDTPGTKPQITIFEQDEVGGDNNSSGAVNLDFSQGAIGDFCDFCHHLFGFLWSFGSLFIFWKVAKYCWDMGYRVVRFHYSLCRKFLGI